MSLFALWGDGDHAVHDAVTAAAVFGADEIVCARFVKGDGQFGNLPGDNHEIGVGVLNLEAVLNIG